MNASTTPRWLLVLLLSASLIFSVGCGDDEEGEDPEPGTSATTGTTGTSTTGTTGTSTTGTTGTTGTTDTGTGTTGIDPVEECQQVCTDLLDRCEDDFLNICTSDALDTAATACNAACEDDNARGQIVAAGALECGTVLPVAISSFPGLDDLCGDPLCGEYCDLMETNCAGDDEVFADRDACLTECFDYDTEGEDGDVSGDTVQCRIYHAGVAEGDSALHCPHAAPDGGGVCVDEEPTADCASYCDSVMTACTGGDAVYEDNEACLAACALFPTDGEDGATSGNSLQCRIYHAGVAETTDPDVHCAHASATGGGVCGDAADYYCNLVLGTCTDGDEVFADREACLAAAGDYSTDGEDGDTAGDTLQCRIYHAEVASQTDPDVHCPHAGPDGGGVCVDEEPTADCASYCDSVMTACTGGNAVYDDNDACLAACALFPADGEDGDTSGNSLQCRIYHAGVAEVTDPDVHCPHASATGGGVCGDAADYYCNLVLGTCTDGDEVFADRDACLTAAGGYSTDGEDGDTSGDSLQCRIYHAEVASQTDPDVHCPHAGPDGGGVCVDANAATCQTYCDSVMAACTGDNEVFANEEECLAECALFPTDGTDGDTSGNTLQCRIYHAGVAEDTDPDLHCPHASPSGGDVCGDDCDYYCNLTLNTCTGENELFADEAECRAACEAYDDSGEDGATEGDTLQCRIYHAEVAFATDPGLHCPHASPDGGGVCSPPASLCDQYCDAAMANCTEDNAIYPNRDECMRSCSFFNEDGTDGDTSGDTVQCRIYHVGVAGDTDPDVHCPHASADGGGVCVDETTPAPVAGDIVITEFLKDPSAAPDATGEWFEVYNTTTNVLDLGGMTISDDGSDSTEVAAGTVIGPGQYFVFAKGNDFATNGGLEFDYFYDDVINLSNGEDEIVLSMGGVELDRVNFNDADFPDTAGTAAQFDGDADPTSDDNNDGQFWCNARTPYGDGDLGTPGMPNVSCSIEVETKSIQEIRNPDAAGHPAESTGVRIEGAVVTAIAGNGGYIWVQAPGGGMWSGLYVEGSAGDFNNLNVGDVVTAEGLYVEQDIGNIGAGTLSTLRANDVTVTGSGAVPAPEVLFPGQLADANAAEPFESTLVRINNASITALFDFGEFGISNLARGNDLLHVIDPAVQVDDQFVFIQGVLNYSFGNFKIEPRDAGDYERPQGQIVDVDISGFAFNPNMVTVNVGDTVRWTQNDGAAHDVRSTDENNNITDSPLNGPLLGLGETYEFTFDTPGTYTYRCAPHSFMQGTVVVNP